MTEYKNIIVTGGAGFTVQNNYVYNNHPDVCDCPDKLTYAGNRASTKSQIVLNWLRLLPAFDHLAAKADV